jgi:hypothetical protein
LLHVCFQLGGSTSFHIPGDNGGTILRTSKGKSNATAMICVGPGIWHNQNGRLKLHERKAQLSSVLSATFGGLI